MTYGSDYHFLPVTSLQSGMPYEVTPNLIGLTVQIVNVYFVGLPGEQQGWVLVDAGMPGSAEPIINVAEERFGADQPPAAIVLTHGHFDHVGSIIELLQRWDVPVYAHHAELPYLTGAEAYLPADPSVGGMVSRLSPWFPNEPIDISARVRPLPSNGTIPDMPSWRWMHTPGHTPGHISLFQEQERVLIAGDAFVTVKQESIYKVFMQELEISGPPKYFTTDWEAAEHSVTSLEALKPEVAVTGHGLPMKGELLAVSLRRLVEQFRQIGMPEQGKYLH